MIVLTPEQMREADARACEKTGDVALMRAAGLAIAQTARRYARGKRVVAFAGPGNNGGDAFAALAELEGFERTVYAQPSPAPSAARSDAEDRARAAGVAVRAFPAAAHEMREALADAGLVIAGLLGTGARLPLPPEFAAAVRAINESGIAAVAIDIPPGLNGETGNTTEPALRARATVALGAMKSGLLLCRDRSVTGEIVVAPIGMPQDVLQAQPRTFAGMDISELRSILPRRGAASDKRSAGAPLIVAGSEQFPGAAVLCAMGAARAGAGYVTVAAPAPAVAALRAHLIEQVVVAIDPKLSGHEAAEHVLELSNHCSALAIGPGLGLDERTGEMVRLIVQHSGLPMVADAGALFHFAKHLELLRGKQIVLTPHEGEFARLSGKGTVRDGTRLERLREFVGRTGITTLLKGEPTLTGDGTATHINTSGTPALATAGTGDVLTGIIATLLAQGLKPVDAARAGAYWHGLAGQSAQRERPRGVIARDVYESLGRVLV